MIGEEWERKIDVILEHTVELLKLKPKVEKLSDDMTAVKSDVVILKVGHQSMQGKVDEILLKLDKKADQKDHLAIDRRVTHIESRV